MAAARLTLATVAALAAIAWVLWEAAGGNEWPLIGLILLYWVVLIGNENYR